MGSLRTRRRRLLARRALFSCAPDTSNNVAEKKIRLLASCALADRSTMVRRKAGESASASAVVEAAAPALPDTHTLTLDMSTHATSSFHVSGA